MSQNLPEPTRKPRKPPVRRQWHARFLIHLKDAGGSITEAAKRVPVDPATVYRHMQRNPDFATAVKDVFALCETIRRDKLEDAAYDRALNGTTEPVYQGGQLVGAKKVYDNRLTIRVLEALDPDKWSKRETHEHTGEVGAVIRFGFDLGAGKPRHDIDGEAEDADQLEPGDDDDE